MRPIDKERIEIIEEYGRRCASLESELSAKDAGIVGLMEDLAESERQHRNYKAAAKDYFDKVASLEQSNSALSAELKEAREVLSEYVYETTHLSPREDDGSHRCRIPGRVLEKARAFLDKKESGRGK